MQLPQLPIFTSIPELKEVLQNSSAILEAPPGSGKTTIVPLALLEEPWLAGKKILILEPRRLAARLAAFRMASLLGEKVGQTVGYQIRFDRKISGSTRVEVLTEGILTRRIQNDADLKGVGLIIFDEFHERSIHADLALALCLDICQLKSDLRLLVMSATLDTGPISQLLGGVPVISGKGQSHKVQIDYLDRPVTGRAGRISEIAAHGIGRVLSERQSDLLVFLPGTGEIKDVHRRLRSDPAYEQTVILPLFGNLSQSDQDSAIMPDPEGRRRIILATSIAETSLTIEGIGCVVDSGWSRRPVFEPRSGLTRLTTLRVSKAAADQRAGRSGRLGPGYCLRLWTRDEHHGLAGFHPPEIVNVDLADLVLELLLWGVSEPGELLWLNQPRKGPYLQAKGLLQSMGAINESGKITGVGKQLAGLPVHPRLGQILLQATKLGQQALACDVVAILSERDILRRHRDVLSVDLQVRIELLDLWRSKGSDAVRMEGGDPGICRRVEQTSRTMRRLMADSSRVHDQGKVKSGQRNIDEVGNLLVAGYPDRIARRRTNQRERYLLASGRGAVLPPADLLAANEYLVIPSLDAGKKEGRVFLAASLSAEDLKQQHRELLSENRSVCWDNNSLKVSAKNYLRLGEIVIEERVLTDVSPEERTSAMLSGIRKMGIECLPWDKQARQLQTRINCLWKWKPELDFPNLSDTKLMSDLRWLEPYLGSIVSAGGLNRLNMQDIFKAMLGWDKMQQLENLAPERIEAASGSNIRIEYREEGEPVLAVRIQEMFGERNSPTVCGGKVVLLLHLLSPAQRPIQVTADLAGFWQRSYPEAKKELKGRYPKHYWPDDPLQAEAIRGVKRKKDNRRDG